MDEKILTDLGLRGLQTNVYISLLKEGPASAPVLASRLGIKRTNAYMLLEKLVELGLVNHSSTGNKQYNALSPNKLKNLLSGKQYELQQTAKVLSASLPRLISQYNLSHQQPGVLHYEGSEGIKLLYDDIIRTKKEVLIFPSKNDRNNYKMSEFIDSQILRQQLAGIKVRAIYPLNSGNLENLSNLSKRNITIREFGDLGYEGQIIVYGDNVALTTYDDTVITTIVISKQIASTQRAIFENIWFSVKN